MTARTRPGTAITDDERLAAVLRDAVDGLENLQVAHPQLRLEDVIHQIRFVRGQLIRRLPEELGYVAEVEQ